MPPAAEAMIELRLGRAEQLFHTLDPSPFREGDLDPMAESYIVAQAQQLPPGTRLHVRVELPPAELARPAAAQIVAAIPRFFREREAAERRAIREILLGGRQALAIGLVILGVSLFGAVKAAALLGEGRAAGMVRESLVILGWVAMWRPAGMFLYDWLPHARRARLFRRLGAAGVTLAPIPPG